uniref:Uncharacterized protein n=1 Tax=Lepeophtheirus salmonis TaxID=72036 RepID=A0A0K2UG68_LEPSM
MNTCISKNSIRDWNQKHNKSDSIKTLAVFHTLKDSGPFATDLVFHFFNSQ